jgi:hypothetical protein
MRRTVSVPLVAFCLAAAPIARADDPPAAGDAEAIRIATEVTTAGAKHFAAKDAQALADTYLDDGRIVLISVDQDSRALKREVREGRSAVLASYQELFKSPDAISAVNRVEYARMLGPDLLEISGTLVLTDSNGMHRSPFTQLRAREGSAWRIAEVQLFLVPSN